MKRDERDASGQPGGVSRRGFIGAVGAGAVGVVAAGKAAADAAVEAAATEPVRIVLQVNGRTHRVWVEPRWSLLHVLRETLGLTGTKPGCERGECGACTVLIDGKPRYSCLTLAVEAVGAQVTTIEGMTREESPSHVVRAFIEEDAFQCGYCTPGQVMTAEGLLRTNPEPDARQVREGMSGNLCRCGAYDHICKAVTKAAALRRGGGA